MNEVVFGDFSDPSKDPRGITSHNYYHTAINNSDSATDYLEAIHQVIPHKVTNAWNSQMAFAKWKWGNEQKKPETWKTPRRQRPFAKIPIIELWKKMFIERTYRGRQVTLWLIGETQTSKSSFAKSLGPHLYSKGILNSNLVHSNCDLLIFDDILIDEFPEYKSFMNCDPFELRTAWNHPQTFDHGQKYGKEGIPCVWTTNYDPRHIQSSRKCDIDWVVGNTLFVDIGRTNLSRPIPEHLRENIHITLPPNWDEYVEDFNKDQEMIRKCLQRLRAKVQAKKK